jgi:hypothetical protein
MLTHDLALAAHAYYAGELATGRRACERLLAAPLEAPTEELVRRNRTWYTPPLEELVPCRFEEFYVEPAREGWSTFNPSIVPTPTGWLVNVRSSNYRIRGGRYEMPPEDGDRILTINQLAELDDQFSLVRTRPLVADYPRTAFPVDGLEDVRLNLVGGELVASATIRNLEPLDGTCRIATANIDAATGQAGPLFCPHTPNERHEKNWMPLFGRRAWLYACSANGRVMLAEPADDGEHWKLTAHAGSPHIAKAWRGGSQLVPVGGGRWLALVHEVAHAEDGRRIYEHRLVEFDEPAGWAISGYSPPFYFLEHRAIEFAAGLAVKDDRLVATFGLRDAEAWLVELELANALAILTRP